MNSITNDMAVHRSMPQFRQDRRSAGRSLQGDLRMKDVTAPDRRSAGRSLQGDMRKSDVPSPDSRHAYPPDVTVSRQMSGDFFEGADELLKALGAGDAAAVGAILDSHPHLATARMGPVRITALQVAASLPDAGQSLAVTQAVLRRCPLVSGEDRLGRGALYHAAARGHLEVVRLLLTAGASPNAAAGMHGSTTDLLDGISTLDTNMQLVNEKLCDVECLGRTPLHQAAKAGHDAVVALLLQAGAQPDASDMAGVTPLLLTGAGVAAKDRAAVARYEKVVEHLVRGGANVNQRNPATGMTALHHATLLCSERAAAELLQAGAVAGAGGGCGGETALHTAASAGCLRVVRLLLDKGGAPLVNSPDQVGCTPLHKAAYTGSRCCLSLLLQRGGNLAAQTAAGFTVVDLIFSYVPRPLNFLTRVLDSGVSSNLASVNDRDFRIRVDFSVLMPEAAELQMDVTSAIMSGSSDLHQMTLFQHPLLELFVRSKWRRLRLFFVAIVALQVCLVVSLSWFIVLRRETFASRQPENSVERALRRVALVSSVTLLLHGLAQVGMYPRHYLRESETWLNLGCSSLVLLVAAAGEVGQPADMAVSIRHQLIVHAAALAVLAAWADLMMLVSRFSVWGYYALMFNAVLLNVTKVLFVFMFLIFGFALSFSIIFYRSPYFGSPWKALLKTTVMMTGEFEYDDMFDDKQKKEGDEWSRLEVTGRVVFLLFILLASIVLMNLMVGLAVSDIQELQTVGHVRKLLKQAEFVVHLEKLTQRVTVCRERLRMLSFVRIDPTFTTQPVLGSTSSLSTRVLESLVGLALRNRRRASGFHRGVTQQRTEDSEDEITDAEEEALPAPAASAAGAGAAPACGDGGGGEQQQVLALLVALRRDVAELRARLEGDAECLEAAEDMALDHGPLSHLASAPADARRSVRRASTVPMLDLGRFSVPNVLLAPPVRHRYSDGQDAQGILRRLRRSARITHHPSMRV
ncbi:transient receptor potential channel pyrexia-like [Schistocerca nitens]|uniref:transient receptor potential channel pyrexia-like n=1 Tax=Schistocerca nitens TaxID=7011 RepID=UPI002117D904|nr:transient receptor potential channel pyrexia-like [Schistocerca nitens]